MVAQLPNTFIVGAPKCGTTSMAAYLNEHEQVFVSIPKEPHFFNDDMKYRDCATLEEYLQIFSVAEAFPVRIDASALYLYSKTAIPNILECCPDAKFIVMLRNPVQMAYSMHSELLSNGQESERDFYKAWNLCDSRRAGRNVPFGNRDASILCYDSLCKLGEQVQRLLDVVDRRNVFFVEFDNFTSHPKDEYENVLRFLELPLQYPSSFERHNPSKVVRSRTLALVSRILSRYKRKLHINFNSGFIGLLHNANVKEQDRDPLSEEVALELETFFREDVLLLHRMLSAD